MKSGEVFHCWQKRVFFTLWITYASFYLCRVNMSVALPGIMREFAYSRAQMGLIGSVFFIVYALGQFINGQLADKWGAKRIVTLGVIGSVILNILFGFSSLLGWMILFWALNGYFQSMGWSPTVKVLANWFPVKGRGRICGLYGTCYQIGNVLSWLFAGYILLYYGWRYVFWVPAALFLLAGIHFYFRNKDAPENIGLPGIEEYEEGRPQENLALRQDRHSFAFTIKQTLGNPLMWRVALSSLCLSIMVYGLLFWMPAYLFEAQGITLSNAAFLAAILPLAGSLGAITAGWATDRFFHSRRIPVIVIMFILAAILILIFPQISFHYPGLTPVLLALIGFMVYGPHVLLALTLAIDYGTRKAAASSAGFIDSFNYIGAAISGIGAGYLVDKWGWNSAFYFWAAAILLAIIIILPLWKSSLGPPLSSKGNQLS